MELIMETEHGELKCTSDSNISAKFQKLFNWLIDVPDKINNSRLFVFLMLLEM